MGISNQSMVLEFHAKFGAPMAQSLSDPELRLTRARLITEEAAEAVIALHTKDRIELADALADLLYVAYGTAITYSIPLDEVLREVHRSNMTKTPLDKNRKGGKGPGFEPPRIREILDGA